MTPWIPHRTVILTPTEHSGLVRASLRYSDVDALGDGVPEALRSLAWELDHEGER